MTHPDLKEFVQTTREVLNRIPPNADVVMTGFDSPNQLKAKISSDLDKLENGDLNFLIKVYTHYLPTGTFQEIWVDEAREKEYMEIADRMDELYMRLKSIEKKTSILQKIKSLFLRK